MRGVKACFNWAADEEIIGRNPLAKLKIPKAIPRGDEAYLMPEEWERLVAAVTDAPFLDFLTILKETGCRPREAAIVENRWYNRHGDLLGVSQGRKQGQRGEPHRPPEQEGDGDLPASCLETPGRPHLSHPPGHTLAAGALNKRCQTLANKLGLHVTPYSIRHTFATDAIIKGVDLQTIAILMGHKDLRMLSRIYQHVKKRSDHVKEGLRKATGEVA